MVKHISKIVKRLIEGEWNGVSKKDFKDTRKTLSELNFDNEDGEIDVSDISVIEDGTKVPLTYLREKSQCDKKKPKV